MSESEAMGRHDSVERQRIDNRHNDADFLVLIPLDPSTIVDCEAVAEGCLVEGPIVMAGAIRETCPVCKTVHLKLVLRQMHVKQAHVFCEQCTRCFDARYPDGSSALLMD